ncbi:TonB-dependent receptor, partial [Eudoraea sp.]|uniref:TonB-dependent receptor n=1 Tax=Eudoraea sp. TaxID=1979955 RepID=UPI003C742BE3
LTLAKGTEVDETGVASPARHAAPTFGDFHIIWRKQRFKTDLFLNYNGEISFNDLALSEISKAYIYAKDSNGNPYSPAWYTLNLRFQFQLSNALRFTLTIENFTNQRYRPYSSGLAAPGFNVIGGVNFRF